MPVTIKDVEYVAKLARLEFTESEKKRFTHQLNDILSYMDKLNKLDTSTVEPLSHVVELSPAADEQVRPLVETSFRGIASERASNDEAGSRSGRTRPSYGMMRDDVVTPSYPREELLMNAPEKSEKFFKVPKVIG